MLKCDFRDKIMEGEAMAAKYHNLMRVAEKVYDGYPTTIEEVWDNHQVCLKYDEIDLSPDKDSEGLLNRALNRIVYEPELSLRFVDKSLYLGPDGKPLPLPEIMKNLTKAGMIWSANMFAKYPDIWVEIHKPQYNQTRCLFYRSAHTTRENGNYFDIGFIERRHPEWFLTAEENLDPALPENRMRWSTNQDDQYYNRFYLDVCNPGFQDWVAEEILKCVSGEYQNLAYPFNGVGFDNVTIGDMRLDGLARTYPNWKYADKREEWTNGFYNYLGKIKEALNRKGYVLAINHSLNFAGPQPDEAWWAGLIEGDCADIVMSEKCLRCQGQGPYYSAGWLKEMLRHKEITDAGMIDWWMNYIPAEPINDDPTCPYGHEAFLYTYCSWLLAKVPGLSFYHARTPGQSESDPATRNWYEEYELPLGQPIGEMRACDSKTYIREFQGGWVIVNPEKTEQDSGLYFMGSGETMLPRSGHIIMKEI